MRITVNGQRAEIQIKRSVDISKWNSQKECAIGKERKSMELNHYLDTVRMKVLQIHRELEQDGKPITADVLKRRYYGEGDSPKMLLEVFQEHNRKYRELMGKDYVAGTVLRYERTARYLGELLQKEYRMNDIPLKEINHEFIARFEHYVKTEKSCAQNATVKYLKNFKKIIKVALVNKWITDDPFLEIHFKQTKTNRAFLTEEELNILLKKEFTIPRLQTVRDIFVFCALTGLAFTDVQHLRYEHPVRLFQPASEGGKAVVLPGCFDFTLLAVPVSGFAIDACRDCRFLSVDADPAEDGGRAVRFYLVTVDVE